VLDLGPGARVAFACAYLATQGVLIATAGKRPDHAFGFRMFAESSTMRVELLREVDAPSGHGVIAVGAPNGAWTARDRGGQVHRIAWRDRVRDPLLSTFDTTIEASYGIAAQLARLKAALDDVATHTPDDDETRRLIADVTVRKNGHEPTVVRLTSVPR
jgi:hypothetical protein